MASQMTTRSGLRVAFEGCGHGNLHNIYSSVKKAADLKGWDGVDLVIIGGDFQAVRNSYDLSCMNVPSKYKEIGDFHEYYSGTRVAPYLTIFVGGNHEASNHLFELYHGGWVAPNIYYLGAANVIRCGPLRIAGLSGIWKGYDYNKPHHERLPYNPDALRSTYHVREYDVRKLLQLRTQVDIGLSHDWPQSIEWAGDYHSLFNKKKGFIEDAQAGRLGSVAAKYVLDRLRPFLWFSAHMHCKYVATLEHGDYVPPTTRNAKPYQGPLPREPQNQPTAAPAKMADEPQPNIAEERIHAPEDPRSGNGERISAWQNFHEIAAKKESEENTEFLRADAEHRRRVDAGEEAKPESQVNYQVTWKKVDVASDGLAREITVVPPEEQKANSNAVKNSDEIDIDLDSSSDASAGHGAGDAGVELPSAPEAGAISTPDTKPNMAEQVDSQVHPEENKPDPVSDELRNQLPASFRKSQETEKKSIVDPTLPEAISNKTTNFLALDKCLPKRDFLQLLELPPISEGTGTEEQRPYNLKYDKEWLAITRVFADGFVVGKDAHVNPNKGDGAYKPKIMAAEAWVEENVVAKGKMTVPQNFTITAPVYDPSVPVTTTDQPVEYENPQTTEFCEMLGISNAFSMTEEQRHAQVEAIAHANEHPQQSRGRGGHRGGRRGRGGFGFGQRRRPGRGRG